MSKFVLFCVLVKVSLICESEFYSIFKLLISTESKSPCSNLDTKVRTMSSRSLS